MDGPAAPEPQPPSSLPGAGDAAPAPPEAAEPPRPAPPLAVGMAVRLVAPPDYLKTADPMPMLRPPDLVDADEVGLVVGLRALEQVAVRFRRGSFLLECRQLESVDP